MKLLLFPVCQVKACYEIVGIPETDIAELQGKVSVPRRTKLWPVSRVIFCTPQTFVNDLNADRIGDPRKIVCIVIDEAHRATGEYAYCQAIRILTTQKSHHRFRILALSATPGKDLSSVQTVIENLLISNMEVRHPDDPDVKRYAFETLEEVKVVKVSPVVARLVSQAHELMRPSMFFLKKFNISCGHSDRPSGVVPFMCIQQMRHVMGNRQRYNNSYQIIDHIMLLARLARAVGMLQKYGIGTFIDELRAMARGLNEKGNRSNATAELSRLPQFTTVMNTVEKAGEDFVHPKVQELVKVLLEHFNRFQQARESSHDDGNDDTCSVASGSVIVFSQYRDSVQEIVKQLKQHRPIIKARFFIGQGSKDRGKKSRKSSKGSPQVGRGQNQKEQKKTVKDFREGKFNVLVATCIAEEGLDIGGVDLVINFDTVTSAVRMVQRAGRTGRKKTGRSVFLLNEGDELKKFMSMKSSSKRIMKQLADSTKQRGKTFDFYENSPRMVTDIRSEQGSSTGSALAPRPVFRDFAVDSPYEQAKVGGYRVASDAAAAKERRRRSKLGLLTDSQTAEMRVKFQASQPKSLVPSTSGDAEALSLSDYLNIQEPFGCGPSISTRTGDIGHGLNTRIFLALDLFIALERQEEFAASLPEIGRDPSTLSTNSNSNRDNHDTDETRINRANSLDEQKAATVEELHSPGGLDSSFDLVSQPVDDGFEADFCVSPPIRSLSPPATRDASQTGQHSEVKAAAEAKPVLSGDNARAAAPTTNIPSRNEHAITTSVGLTPRSGVHRRGCQLPQHHGGPCLVPWRESAQTLFVPPPQQSLSTEQEGLLHSLFPGDRDSHEQFLDAQRAFVTQFLASYSHNTTRSPQWPATGSATTLSQRPQPHDFEKESLLQRIADLERQLSAATQNGDADGRRQPTTVESPKSSAMQHHTPVATSVAATPVVATTAAAAVRHDKSAVRHAKSAVRHDKSEIQVREPDSVIHQDDSIDCGVQSHESGSHRHSQGKREPQLTTPVRQQGRKVQNVAVSPPEVIDIDEEDSSLIAPGNGTTCEVCHKGSSEDKLLLCDGCDKEYHIFCLRPRLDRIPTGKFFGPCCKERQSTTRILQSPTRQVQTPPNAQSVDESPHPSQVSSPEIQLQRFRRLTQPSRDRSMGGARQKARQSANNSRAIAPQVRPLRSRQRTNAKAARKERLRKFHANLVQYEAEVDEDDDASIDHHDEDAAYHAEDLDQDLSGLIDDESLGYDSSVSSQEESGFHRAVKFDSPAGGGVAWLTKSKHGRSRNGRLSTIEAAVQQLQLRQSSQAVRHVGYCCDACKQEPIVGNRYHCATCKNFDVCAVCVQDPHSTRGHDSHQILVYEEEAVSSQEDDLSNRDSAAHVSQHNRRQETSLDESSSLLDCQLSPIRRTDVPRAPTNTGARSSRTSTALSLDEQQKMRIEANRRRALALRAQKLQSQQAKQGGPWDTSSGLGSDVQRQIPDREDDDVDDVAGLVSDESSIEDEDEDEDDDAEDHSNTEKSVTRQKHSSSASIDTPTSVPESRPGPASEDDDIADLVSDESSCSDDEPDEAENASKALVPELNSDRQMKSSSTKHTVGSTTSCTACVATPQAKLLKCFVELDRLLKLEADDTNGVTVDTICLPLTGAHFMVSQRMAIKVVGEMDFSKSTSRGTTSLRESLAELATRFERIILIVQGPNVPAKVKGKGRSVGRAVPSLLTMADNTFCRSVAYAQCWGDRINVLYSASARRTGSIVFSLLKSEVTAGYGLSPGTLTRFGPHPFDPPGKSSGREPSRSEIVYSALSLLRSLPGVGCVTAILLLQKFGTLRNVLQATPHEICRRLPGLPKASANMFTRQLHKRFEQLKT